VCVVGFSAFYSFKGNRGYSARVDLVQGVKESSEQCVCEVELTGSCVFLKLCEHCKVRITEYLPCL
jgi:hypothetical protein